MCSQWQLSMWANPNCFHSIKAPVMIIVKPGSCYLSTSMSLYNEIYKENSNKKSTKSVYTDLTHGAYPMLCACTSYYVT